MKTIKLQNTVNSKIESNSFSDVINTMRNEKIEMTPSQKENYVKNTELIQSFEEQKKFQKQFNRLRGSLEACRESRPTNSDNAREKNTFLYWETTLKQSEGRIEKLKREMEAKIRAITERYNVNIKNAEDSCAIVKERFEQAKETLRIGKKTKEEIRLEKQITQLAMDFKSTNPDKDIEYYFPGYRNLINAPIPIPAPEPEPAPIPPPVQEEEEEEKEEKPWSEMTHWERYLKANPSKSIYSAYHSALADGITPDIPEPIKPNKRRGKTTTETVSRESLAKILPNYA